MNNRCSSIHAHGGMKCIRKSGHDGLCWSRAAMDRRTGAITRGEWYSVNGAFRSHYQYATKYSHPRSKA